MIRRGNESGEVGVFMQLFRRLKEWSDDDPAGLPELARSDDSVRELCWELNSAASPFTVDPYGGSDGFVSPVNTAFIREWRDYEARYREPLWNVCYAPLVAALVGDHPVEETGEIADDPFNAVRKSAAVDASYMSDLSAAASWVSDRDGLGEWDTDQLLVLDDALELAERLRNGALADLEGILRRARLTPFVLVPAQLARRHGGPEADPFFLNLKDARTAFVFGAPRAALALMRSIMEAVLRDHYRAVGKDLKERIDNVRRPLPPQVKKETLHRLRKRANAILHLDRDNGEELSRMDEMQLEREIVSLLFVLRALIEGAK